MLYIQCKSLSARWDGKYHIWSGFTVTLVVVVVQHTKVRCKTSSVGAEQRSSSSAAQHKEQQHKYCMHTLDGYAEETMVIVFPPCI